MGTLHHEIRIDATPERVWAVLADLEAVQHYNPGVSRAQYLGTARAGIGAQRRCELKPTGTVTERVTAWEPGRMVGLEVVESPWPLVYMHWRTEVHPNGRGTVVRQALHYRLKFGPLGWLLDRLVLGRKLNGALDDVFAGLKRYAEQGASAA